MEFTLVKVDKHGRSQYRVNGSKNTTVRFGASFFQGAPPETIEVTAANIAEVKGPKVKLTKEERAALPKPTPEQKVADAKAKAQKAADRAARLEAALAKQVETADM